MRSEHFKNRSSPCLLALRGGALMNSKSRRGLQHKIAWDIKESVSKWMGKKCSGMD